MDKNELNKMILDIDGYLMILEENSTDERTIPLLRSIHSSLNYVRQFEDIQD